MTLEELRTSTKEMLAPADIAPILRCKPYAINLQARIDPAKLGFKVSQMGTRVKIPRRAFIVWMEEGERGGCAIADKI